MTKQIDEDVAVIGMGLKFPGDATSPEDFYDLLLKGRSALRETPKDRYNVDAFYHPDQDRLGAVNVRYAHYLKDDIAAFDAPFFSITPNEAIYMDPQQRGLLETVYHALENAGIPMTKAVGSNTSVHIGCFTREYDGVMCRDPEVDLKYIATGTGTALLSNRLSWFYDFRGPSLTLDSACSSSLNACHLAVQGLRSGETSMAIVGGCNLFYNPDTMIPLTSLGFLSPDGKCYTFDHRANGYSRGEGFGIVVLKRVSDALRDGDTIRAVIRSTSSNQDGKSPGITQPTRSGQVALIRNAYKTAGLDLAITRFFEAHGTGTPMGDPIEAGAISDVFTVYRSPKEPMYVGALKSNIGHLEGAAGIAGLIKVVHVLERGIIPPNIWFEKPNPKIPADKWNLKFPTEMTVWPQDGLRRASVNSFGYGGSNAHVILDDAYHYLKEYYLTGIHRTVVNPAVPKLVLETNGEINEHYVNGNGITNGADSNRAHTNGINFIDGNGINGINWNHPQPADQRMFLLSAYDEDGVKRLAKAYKQYLSNISPTIDDEETFLNDLSYTLSSKRTLFSWRASVIAKDVSSLQDALSTPVPVKSTGTTGRLAFIFSGQGAQWHAMGRELMVFPVFRSSLEAADSYLKELWCSWSLIEEFLKDKGSSLIDDAKYSQPICTALQIALTELLWSWSVRPDAVVGHSSGEIAAAFAAGAISRESAWRIAYYRGLLCSEVPTAGGERLGMLSVALSPEKAEEHIARVNSTGHGCIVIACFNSPKNVTVSGNAQKLEELQALLNAESIFNRRLKVGHAYHSSYMEATAGIYGALIGNIAPPEVTTGSKSTPHIYSSLTGDRLQIRELQIPTYWVNNLISPVKFSQAVTQMFIDRPVKAKLAAKQEAIEPVTELLEVGPHSVLQGPLREIMEKLPSARDVGYGSVLKRNVDAVDSALGAAGWLYCRGQSVDIEVINKTETAVPPARMMTGLPPYVFNHSKAYWKESRLSKGYRYRQHPRLELLGAPVPDWNKSNAIWRNWIRLSENPWLKDHRITGSILYPGAGMIIMAIEASRQLASPKKILKGFRLREIVFQVALRVPTTTDGIETHFYVRPYFDSTSSTSSNWNEFQLSSFDGEEWRDHCRGLIQPDYEVAVNPIDNGLEEKAFVESCAQTVHDAELACQKRVSSKQLYELLHTVGFDFGETFQNLSDVAIDGERGAVATVTAPNIKNKMPFSYVQPHLIHPTTLDGVLQTVIVALTRGGREAGDAMVPTSVKELWIAAADADGKTHESLRLCAKASFLGLRQATASATAVNPATKKPIITIDGFVSTVISGNNGQHATGESAHHHLCFNLDWKPDITLLGQDNANRLFRAQIPAELADTDPSEVIADVERICYMYLRRYFKDHHDDAKIDPSRPWYQKYISWMKHQFERYERSELIHAAAEDWNRLAEDNTYFSKLEQKLQDSTPEAKMSVTVGRVLGPILQGTVDPLEILFTDSHMENVYRHGTGAEIGYAYLASYLDVLAHKNSDLVILEIGAGTGGATVPILDMLMRHGDTGGHGAARFELYDFTDISPSFFETAKRTFTKLADRMRFETLNIEKNPLEQGFEAEKYDVIIAGNVIHATKNIDHTLRNVRMLLKPHGKFILNELTNSTLVRTGFGFGLLPGWWLSEEANRQWGPLMEISDWKTHLKRTGFDGVDFSFRDYEDAANQLNSVIVATASAPEPEARSLPPTFVVYDAKSTLQLEASKILKHELTSWCTECEIVPLSQLTSTSIRFDQKLCIFLGELDEPLLDHVDELFFKSLQQMTTSLNSMVWLSNGGGPASQNPNSELVTGFARVIRQENPTIRFLTLSIDQVKGASETAQSTLRLIDEVIVKNLNNKSVPDNTFHESNGVIHISRLVEASYMNDAIALKTATPTAHEGKFGGDPNRALKLVIGSPGLLDTLQFVDDSSYELPLTDGDVEFRVMAAGLNFLDIMIALGQVIGNDLGVEGSGIVTRTASNSKFQVGDRICGIAAGTLNTYARAKETSIARVPDTLSWSEAAGFTVVFVTAYAALYDIADIQPGETVLIHAAAGGVGQACIQLAQVRGAEIFTTVGSVEKRDLLIEKYGIARDHIFSSRDLTFARGIKRMTKGRGVDVAVNSLSGDALRATWECIASFGRFAEVGKMDIYSSARLNMEKFKNNVRFEFVDISFIAANNGQRFSNILENLMVFVHEGKIGPLHPTQVFPFSQIQESFRYMQSGVHSGKIVLEPHDDDLVPIVPSRKSSCKFDPNASFVISGGLGGLGRSIARWMASRGAMNLILLSRSGNTKHPAKKLLHDLEELGVRVATPRCDVSDLDSLRRALNECSAAGMPPIKGCIQGAMVLRDSTFANMTVDDYYTALRPKLDGSWNLHNELPKDLDFFILLSSISAIVGNRGQSNYNMGNSFQDALARYRVLNGLKATALDLGMVLSVGYVAENDSDLINHLRDVGVEPMREEEFLTILDELCNPKLATGTPLTKSQISLGLQMPETRIATGAEEPGWMRDPLFCHLYRIRTLEGAAESDGKSVNYALLLAGADTFEQATEIVYEAMVGKLVKALNISLVDIDPSKPLHALGVDSLVAVELRTWMLKQLDSDVAVFDLMEVASLRALANLIATRSSYVKKDDGEEKQQQS